MYLIGLSNIRDTSVLHEMQVKDHFIDWGGKARGFQENKGRSEI